jgi:nucleoside-diphosphate-sugar epimerase
MTGANGVRVLVTGANGFVGQALCLGLYEDEKHEVVAAVRGVAKFAGILHYQVGDIHAQACCMPMRRRCRC